MAGLALTMLHVVAPAVAQTAPPAAPPIPAGAPENPAGRVTLRDALALALRQSPELAGYAWEMRARESALIQAGRAPNPIADVMLEDLGRDSRPPEQRVVQPQATVQLSQLIELGGKRAGRRKVAALDRDLAGWDYEAARIDALTRVTTAFLDVVAGQQALALAGRARLLIEQVEQTVRARVEAGVVSPIEQTKAGVAVAMSRIDEQRATRALAADRTSLAALWGQPVAVFESAAGEVSALPALPPLAGIELHAMQHPEVARWATEIARRDAARALEAARAVPDVTITAGYRRFTAADNHAFVVGASIPLPVFDRNHAGIQAAADRVAQARDAERAARLRVTALLAQAYRDLATAHDEAAALAGSVLPGARSAFAAIEEGYRLGRFGFLEVLDAQRTLVAAETQHLRALAGVHKAVAQVERLIGVPLAAAAAPKRQ